jgi:hypothetical protein
MQDGEYGLPKSTKNILRSSSFERYEEGTSVVTLGSFAPPESAQEGKEE